MKPKVTTAIARLESILPLQANLASLDETSRNTYQQILSAFVEHGQPPAGEPVAVLRQLAAKDMITTDRKGEITGAYPFTMQARVHQVSINGYQLHAMCALDALAPSAMFKCKSSIDSQCAVTRQAVHIELDNKAILNNDPTDIYFGINWQAACSTQSCSESLCTEMLFLSDKNIAEQWLNEDSGQREIFTLPDAIEFAAGFFVHLVRKQGQ